jgi:hypothetical protein
MLASADSMAVPVVMEEAAEVASLALRLSALVNAPAMALRAVELVAAAAAAALLPPPLLPAAEGQSRAAVEEEERAEAAAASVVGDTCRLLEGEKREMLAAAAAALVAEAAPCPALLHSESELAPALPLLVPRMAPAAVAALSSERGSPPDAPLPPLPPPPAVSTPTATSAAVCPCATVGGVSVSASCAPPLPPHASTAPPPSVTAPPTRLPPAPPRPPLEGERGVVTVAAAPGAAPGTGSARGLPATQYPGLSRLASCACTAALPDQASQAGAAGGAGSAPRLLAVPVEVALK